MELNLCSDVADVLNHDSEHHDKIVSLLNDYYYSADISWQSCCFWKPGTYTRNLMFSNDRFEVIIICWDTYTESPIHDHDNKDCWFLVLQGSIQEVCYHFSDNKLHQLQQERTNIYESGQVSSAGVTWHKMSSQSSKAITLHIYSKPIEYCSIYCLDTDQITRVKNNYYSKYGKILD